jgi:hypothetical protein
MLQREKAAETKAAAERAEAERERARLHNPAGGADLFITGSRPKRAVTATKNPDGSARTKKRSPAELAAEEDQRMLDGFANQKRKAAEDLPGSGAPKKGKTAAKGKAAATAGGMGKRKAAGPAASALAAKKCVFSLCLFSLPFLTTSIERARASKLLGGCSTSLLFSSTSLVPPSTAHFF